jgi:cyclohexanecarboxylate-CoA ligase
MTGHKSFDAAAHAAAMRTAGYWTDTTFEDVFAKSVISHPSKTAVIADRADRPRRRFTYRDLEDLVARATASLGKLGISHGDIVGVQLPNWWEFVVLALACGRIGAVVNPLMPIFRERELEYMLGFAEAKMLVVPKLFRSFDHEAMAASLRSKLPHVKHVVVVDGAGDNSFDASLLGSPPTAGSTPASAVRRSDELSVLMYTSGTTGSPKGAMHTTNTLMACADNMAARLGLIQDDVLLICSPLGHMTGYAAGVLLGLRLGATLVLQDIWEPRRGTALMAEEGITYAAGATPFLADILEVVAAGAPRPTALRRFLCAGAPIPPVLINRASAELDLTVCSVWGMTEALAGTMTEPATARQKSAATDGHAMTGMEVRVLDAKGAPANPGETGRLFVRGSQMFIGYFKRPDLVTFDADGWFDTGDLAYMDAEGYIRINGRTKDVIIRGGENVPVAEIENLLIAHPAILAAAVVGYPDARLGERGCAFVVLRPGQSFDLPALQAYLAECKMAKQYWPERVVVAAELPRTPSGKVQKFVLKEEAGRFANP